LIWIRIKHHVQVALRLLRNRLSMWLIESERRQMVLPAFIQMSLRLTVLPMTGTRRSRR
jgi:hypothetical protein